ncbi:peptide methionine sulfoxide reductase [Mangrovimonas yunxiaonensis]|uniref:Peptide methionine sulfoxide reductase MsrA n=1 Tax=Mangrovimonas yunxiaonensis TaxID=1197477 RepID=A0A084TI77_9FLAO|nr:peptide-methionine (S)-S-oxide reductase MsrA [Mangrovimonas yunxiaonensis]KFB00413.1 peptide methionine sulfoxide reductase [Mangrovimonas yunxiaonensis]
MKQFVPILMVVLLFNCNNHAHNNPKKQQAMTHNTPIEIPLQNGKARAYFASGCFWCVEAIYESVIGVDEAISGYSGGHTKNPTYESSNTGQTGHAEAVEVIYDPNIVSYANLIDVYFSTQDPTQINGQGPDWGSQYRSIIFYQNDEQKQIAEAKKAEWAKKIGGHIAAEIMPFQKFWEAEAYHQNYEKRNPNNPYIQNVSKKRLDKLYQSCPLLVKKNVQDLIKDLNKH